MFFHKLITNLPTLLLLGYLNRFRNAPKQLKNASSDFEKSLHLNVISMHMVGAIPVKCLNVKFYGIYSFFIWGFLIIPVASFPVIQLFISQERNLKVIAANAYLSSEIILIPFKLLTLLLKRKELLEILRYYDRVELKHLNTEKHKKMMEHGLNNVKRNSTMFISACMVALVLMFSKPVLGFKKKPLMSDMWFPFDPQASYVHYTFYVVYMSSCT